MDKMTQLNLLYYDMKMDYIKTPVSHPIHKKKGLRWMGSPITKHATDLIAYQQIIHAHKPEIIVECGTQYGGSALFFAHILDAVADRGLRSGRIISIDIDNGVRTTKLPKHKRITYLTGSSVDESILAEVRKVAMGKETMVCLDSDHREEHVFNELVAYVDIVTPGQYIVVEDTDLNGHPVRAAFGPGPHEAIVRFLEKHPDIFEQVPWEEKIFLSHNVGGWLRKKSI